MGERQLSVTVRTKRSCWGGRSLALSFMFSFWRQNWPIFQSMTLLPICCNSDPVQTGNSLCPHSWPSVAAMLGKGMQVAISCNSFSRNHLGNEANAPLWMRWAVHSLSAKIQAQIWCEDKKSMSCGSLVGHSEHLHAQRRSPSS